MWRIAIQLNCVTLPYCIIASHRNRDRDTCMKNYVYDRTKGRLFLFPFNIIFHHICSNDMLLFSMHCSHCIPDFALHLYVFLFYDYYFAWLHRFTFSLLSDNFDLIDKRKYKINFFFKLQDNVSERDYQLTISSLGLWDGRTIAKHHQQTNDLRQKLLGVILGLGEEEPSSTGSRCFARCRWLTVALVGITLLESSGCKCEMLLAE